MRRFSFLVFLFPLSLAWAHSKDHSHKAHVHGAAELSVAFEGLKGQLIFEAPSEAIVGFEHKAKSKSDQKRVEAALALFEEKIPSMVILPSEAGCVWKKTKLEKSDEAGGHSDVEAEFSIDCQKSLKGLNVSFDFSKNFPRLKTVDVQWIVDDLQKSLKVRESGDSLELK